MTRAKRLVFVAAVAMAVVFVAGPASAVVIPPPGPARSGSNTEMVMAGTGPGGGVNGFIGPPGSVSDPSVPYPAAPPAGFTSHPEGFAGIILGQPTSPPNSPLLQLYCIDIRTSTWGGIGYVLGSWDASNVPNVGFVAYLLNNYFPNVPTAPAGLADDNQRAAAVQAAIWYFSDK